MKIDNFKQRQAIDELMDLFFNPSIDSETSIINLIDNLSYYDYINESDERDLKAMFTLIKERIQDSLKEFDNKQIDAINRVINVQPNK